MIKYHYAYDENNNLVNVNLLDRCVANTHPYYCLGCGNKLFPKLGNIKAHHFAHKKDVDCDGESYLHRLAKIKIKEKFDDKSKPFNIKLIKYYFCKDINKCPFSHNTCYKYSLEEIDLHKYYDTCTEEQTIFVESLGTNILMHNENGEDMQKYIADLMLSDSKMECRTPLLIEIYCSHKCEHKKIYSKLKIIEMHITSEEDIDKFTKNTVIESDITSLDSEACGIKFFNFKSDFISQNKLGLVKIKRFVYFNNDKIFFIDCTCEDLNTRYSNHSIIELNMLARYPTYTTGLIYLINKGYKIKNCMLCKFCRKNGSYLTSNPFCHHHKKLCMPINPLKTDAGNCPYYVACQDFIDEQSKHLREMIIIEV